MAIGVLQDGRARAAYVFRTICPSSASTGSRRPSWTNPALTTIEQPIAEIAQTAVDTLRTLIEDPKALPNSYFRPNLRIRSSTGPAPR